MQMFGRAGLELPAFLNSVSSQINLPADLPTIPIGWKALWVPNLVWTWWQKKTTTSVGNPTLVDKPEASPWQEVLECRIKLRTHNTGILCLTKHHSMKLYRGSGGIAPRILYFGTRWRWVISFTSWPFYP